MWRGCCGSFTMRPRRPFSPTRSNPTSPLSSFDLHLFNEGTHTHLYEKLGAHPAPDGSGTMFGVWAPNADSVSVMGDFNGWDRGATALQPREQSGIWEGFVPGAKHGS